jgi:hypothetical protein
MGWTPHGSLSSASTQLSPLDPPEQHPPPSGPSAPSTPLALAHAHFRACGLRAGIDALVLARAAHARRTAAAHTAARRTYLRRWREHTHVTRTRRARLLAAARGFRSGRLGVALRAWQLLSKRACTCSLLYEVASAPRRRGMLTHGWLRWRDAAMCSRLNGRAEGWRRRALLLVHGLVPWRRYAHHVSHSERLNADAHHAARVRPQRRAFGVLSEHARSTSHGATEGEAMGGRADMVCLRLSWYRYMRRLHGGAARARWARDASVAATRRYHTTHVAPRWRAWAAIARVRVTVASRLVAAAGHRTHGVMRDGMETLRW